MAMLFRLAEPEAGGVLMIDGVNICDLGLHDLRKVISIIPQVGASRATCYRLSCISITFN